MKSFLNLICGGTMSQNPKTKSSSTVFLEWIDEMNKILSEVPMNNISGEMVEYSDHEWQKAMKQLQQCSMKFEDMPIYPINEEIANRLVADHLKGKDEQPDH